MSKLNAIKEKLIKEFNQLVFTELEIHSLRKQFPFEDQGYLNKLEEDSVEKHNEVCQSFFELYYQSHEEKYYWKYCSYESYMYNYKTRLKEFLNNSIDLDEIDFLRNELKEINLNNPEKEGFFEVDLSNYLNSKPESSKVDGRLSLQADQNYKLLDVCKSWERKKKFIEEELLKLNMSSSQLLELNQGNQDKLINYSIILLARLGVLSFLVNNYPALRKKKVNKPNNAHLARLLSKFIGGNPTSIAVAINAYYTNDKTNDNNPEYAEGNLGAVFEILSNLNIELNQKLDYRVDSEKKEA